MPQNGHTFVIVIVVGQNKFGLWSVSLLQNGLFSASEDALQLLYSLVNHTPGTRLEYHKCNSREFRLMARELYIGLSLAEVV